LHNLRSIYSDYQQHGEKIWESFRGGKEGSLWYYHELVQAFEKHGKTPMLTELDKVLRELVALVDSNNEGE
jgi:hypothetical protein